jgi:hypothetical protein
MSDSRNLVAKLVAGSNVLRDSGVNMYEYTEQLTYLLFLKMAEERHPAAEFGAGRTRRVRLASIARPVG